MDNPTASHMASTQRVMSWGKRYSKDADREAFHNAAEYLAISTADPREYRSLMFWWEEGVRDYAGSTERVGQMMDALALAAEDLLTRPQAVAS